MKNLKRLSRQDLKEITGGKACIHYVQADNGQWFPRTGQCVTTVEWQQVGNVSVPIKSSYCSTGLGQVAVTSNGGESRCP